MKVLSVVFTFSVIFGVNCQYLVEKPSWLKTCAQSDPNFKQCHLESIRELFQNVIKGNYKIDGIDSMDPVFLEKVQIVQGNGGGPVALDASLSKLTIRGLSNLEVFDNSVDKNYSWTTLFKIPKLRVEGNYQMRGQILVIPLNGNGKCFLEATDVKIKLRTKSKFYAKNEHTHFNVTDLQLNFKVEGLKLKFTNLFQGSKELDDGINQYLNQNWKVTLDALKPIISKTIADIMIKFVQNVYHHIPGEYVISDIPKPNEISG